MSIQRVIIDAGQGPSAVLIDSLDVPKIVEVRQGPIGPEGPTGPAGSNSVTSSTTSDGTADLYLETVSFNTSNGGPSELGEAAWDSTNGTLDLVLEDSVIGAILEDGLIRIRNTSGATIPKGAALAYTGTTGASGKLEVASWESTNVTDTRIFIGFAAAEMANNSNGYAVWFGKLEGIATDGSDQGETWADGEVIYALPGTPATLTNVEPSSGEFVTIAAIINAGSGTSGVLFVRPSFDFSYGSAALVDTSTGGNGAADAGKTAIFGGSGQLRGSSDAALGVAVKGDATAGGATGIEGTSTATTSTAVKGIASGVLSVGVTGQASESNSIGVQARNTGTGFAFTAEDGIGTVIFGITAAGGATVSSAFAQNLLAALGIPVYADLTAANSALNAGDIYFDQSLGKCRAATA